MIWSGRNIPKSHTTIPIDLQYHSIIRIDRGLWNSLHDSKLMHCYCFTRTYDYKLYKMYSRGHEVVHCLEHIPINFIVVPVLNYNNETCQSMGSAAYGSDYGTECTTSLPAPFVYLIARQQFPDPLRKSHPDAAAVASIYWSQHEPVMQIFQSCPHYPE